MGGNRDLRILLVDDDRDLLDLLKYNFEKEGFLVSVVSKIDRALSVAKKVRPDLIVLDVMMPNGSGIELCKIIRSDSCFKSIPIFFLSARAEDQYRDAALKMGADDFIEKLSGIRALTSKVTAVLKNRFIIRKGIPVIKADDLVIYKRLGLVFCGNDQIQLNTIEFEILFFFMQNPNKVVSGKTLIKIIWGSETYVLDSSVHPSIVNLQRKIGKVKIEILNKDQYRFNQGSPGVQALL